MHTEVRLRSRLLTNVRRAASYPEASGAAARSGSVAKFVRGRAKAAVDGRVGWSGRFDLEPGFEKLRGLGQGGRAEAEGSLDDAGLPANVAGDVEG